MRLLTIISSVSTSAGVKTIIKNTLAIIVELLAIGKYIMAQTSNDLTLYFHHRQEIINNGSALGAADWK